ncbi:hypothetical protein BpHYR1_026458 [Brachionus plicatilis]|uniref:Uncharacterized protein n=1 Tax=Brachionus plicatilis TaxID=10195 RepID=A0A3M7QX75_BRAPC|nr:hypothetical protein BpHYR1_026458 [Brachionus plicatilis]
MTKSKLEKEMVFNTDPIKLGLAILLLKMIARILIIQTKLKKDKLNVSIYPGQNQTVIAEASIMMKLKIRD